MSMINKSYDLLIELQKKDKKPWGRRIAQLLYMSLYVLNVESVSPQYLIELYHKVYGGVSRKDITSNAIGSKLKQYKPLYDKVTFGRGGRFVTAYVRKGSI